MPLHHPRADYRKSAKGWSRREKDLRLRLGSVSPPPLSTRLDGTQVVLLRDLLGAQVLFYRHRIIGATLTVASLQNSPSHLKAFGQCPHRDHPPHKAHSPFVQSHYAQQPPLPGKRAARNTSRFAPARVGSILPRLRVVRGIYRHRKARALRPASRTWPVRPDGPAVLVLNCSMMAGLGKRVS